MFSWFTEKESSELNQKVNYDVVSRIPSNHSHLEESGIDLHTRQPSWSLPKTL